MARRERILDQLIVKPGTPAALAERDPGWRGGPDYEGLTKAELHAESNDVLARGVKDLSNAQELLWASDTYAVLVVFQAMDAAGKDSAIEHVMSGVNPQGVQVVSFKQPSAEELDHTFLWRISKAAPERGRIGIFNRSHYEDVLVPRVHGLVSGDRIEARYGQINAFERHLAENDVTILKFYLHISKKEQKARLQARLDDPTKRWKFSPADLAERKHWHDYVTAYRIALERCSTEWAPWFIVPADRKWYRNAVVARILRTTLEALDLTYPPDPPGLDKIRIE
jgi:PPK2 family polyphosphate:nucleotide phosphotransferase